MHLCVHTDIWCQSKKKKQGNVDNTKFKSAVPFVGGMGADGHNRLGECSRLN